MLFLNLRWYFSGCTNIKVHLKCTFGKYFMCELKRFKRNQYKDIPKLPLKIKRKLRGFFCCCCSNRQNYFHFTFIIIYLTCFGSVPHETMKVVKCWSRNYKVRKSNLFSEQLYHLGLGFMHNQWYKHYNQTLFQFQKIPILWFRNNKSILWEEY